jgi:hypothetical protein
MTYFRYGGVNVTFFDLPTYYDNRTKENYFDLLEREKLYSMESLLIADAWETLIRTINRMFNSTNDFNKKFKLLFQRDRSDNDFLSSRDCRNKFIQPSSLGNIYFDYLLNTNFQGLTGYVQFSNITGQRMNYTFDVYRVTRNNMPKQIGIFRAPNILEVKF